ncbi:MAG TPA: OB-fold domain-containing protein [Bryobacteraceae bacterium]|nr:OB-fold domain-containing protein [Bryobacteraceae bacterium]
MSDQRVPAGVVYTETVVFAPPEQYAADAPYQLAIIDLDSGPRTTVRILANQPDDRVRIGDKVLFVEERNGVAYYRSATAAPSNTSETTRPLI